MRKLLSLFLMCGALWADGCLDFETAWQRVVSYAPSIAAADAEVYVKEAETLQVSLLPNPVAVIEADNIGVDPSEDAEPPQTTFALSQLVEIGGKRCARAEFASSLAGIAYWDSQIARLDLRLAFTVAFIDVSMAQERLRLAQERQCLAGKVLETIGMKVDGGKVSPIQEKKAQIALMAAQIYVREACSEYEQTKKRLAAIWGSVCPDFDGVEFALFECTPLPCECCLTNGLYGTPDFEKAKQLILSATKNLRLQRVNSIPDVTLTVGYRVFHDSDQRGWVVGAEFPLPFFNVNQGNIARACAEINQAEFQMEELTRGLTEKILLTYERLAAAFEESEMIRSSILTEAIDTFNLIDMGYQNGKLEYLDLLDAQKTLFEIQEQYLDIMYDYHLNKAELDRITGQ